jgi:hypothetical protein
VIYEKQFYYTWLMEETAHFSAVALKKHGIFDCGSGFQKPANIFKAWIKVVLPRQFTTV